MLKFINKDKDGNERKFHIAVVSVQGGVQLEFDMYDNGALTMETLSMTPADAAFFVSQTEKCGYVSCNPVGMTRDGASLAVYKSTKTAKWHFVGHAEECRICVGKISAVSPAFVVEAICDALKAMMPSLMYSLTGEMTGYFGERKENYEG